MYMDSNVCAHNILLATVYKGTYSKSDEHDGEQGLCSGNYIGGGNRKTDCDLKIMVAMLDAQTKEKLGKNAAMYTHHRLL